MNTRSDHRCDAKIVQRNLVFIGLLVTVEQSTGNFILTIIPEISFPLPNPVR
jgi:hypothetical protein